MAPADAIAPLPGPAPRPGDRAARAACPADPRADGGRRRVALSPAGVVIERRVGRVSMRLTLPAAAYRGVALGVVEAAGGVAYEVRLAHRDRDLDAVLARLPDECEALAEWRLWARWFALPALIEREAGVYADADARDPRLPRPRRRTHVLGQRRTRFALRRRMGETTRMAQSHRGEREIVCYE
ncbi:MAG: hypothetical protein JNK46_10215 [Methylobacteriaceae bacterium]|nr:hypothetical protein [Methylobacteriaceae bacterium]